jgi:hypothetical protein
VEDESDKSDKQAERDDGTSTREPWVAPKLEFVEPKLTQHGDLTKVTGQFFGSFSPGQPL